MHLLQSSRCADVPCWQQPNCRGCQPDVPERSCVVQRRGVDWVKKRPIVKLGLAIRCVVLAMLFVSTLMSADDCQDTTYECALQKVRKGQFHTALSTLEAVLARSPSDLKTMNLLGIALTGSEDIEKANDTFLQVLSIDSSFSPALRNLAVNEFNLGQRNLSKSHFSAVLELDPTDEIAHFYLGELAFDNKKWDRCVGHYNKSIDQVLDTPQVMLKYATCLLQLEKIQEAIAVLRQLDLDEAELQFRAGTLLGKAAQYVKAAEHFGHAARRYAEPYSASYNQILMLIRGSMFREAIEVAQTMLDEGHRPAELYNLISEAYLGDHQLQQAYDALRSATQVDPQHEKSYGDLISLCMGFSNFQLGLDIANVGIHYIPTSYRLHVQRGVMQAKLGRLSEAKKDFQHAAELSPEESLPHATLAIALMQQGLVSDAIVSLRKQLAITPDYFLSRYLLGEALVRSGVGASDVGSNQALDSFKAAVRLHPRFAPARVSLGKLLLKRDQVDAAIEHLEVAMALEPDQSAPIYQLAMAYQRQGNPNRARELMSRVRAIAEHRRNETMDSVLRDVIRESRSQVD